MSDSIFHTVLDLVDNIKTKLTDQEYKKIAESIAEAKSKDSPKFYRIRYRLVSTHMKSLESGRDCCGAPDGGTIITTAREGLALCELTNVSVDQLNPFDLPRASRSSPEEEAERDFENCRFDIINRLTVFGVMNTWLLAAINLEIDERGYSHWSATDDRNHHKDLTIFSIKEKERTKK